MLAAACVLLLFAPIAWVWWLDKQAGEIAPERIEDGPGLLEVRSAPCGYHIHESPDLANGVR
jgi:hypothetical protein